MGSQRRTPKILILATEECAYPGANSVGQAHLSYAENTYVLRTREPAMFPEKFIALLAGGFHLRDYSEEDIVMISTKLMEMGVKAIAPSHCTGQAASGYFKGKWRDDYKSLSLGEELVF